MDSTAVCFPLKNVEYVLGSDCALLCEVLGQNRVVTANLLLHLISTSLLITILQS